MSKSSRRSPKRPYTQAPVAVDPGVPCSHCGETVRDPAPVAYPNGNSGHYCPACHRRFVVIAARREKG